MKIQWKTLITCIAIPFGIGGLSTLLTGDSMEIFASLNKPPLSPPGWLFPVIWSLLYFLMGIASYLIVTSEKPNDTALAVYAIQLMVNLLWSVIFFHLEAYFFAFIWLILLWVLILLTILLFYRISKPAAYLMIPYLLWVTFAGYLNLAISLLN